METMSDPLWEIMVPYRWNNGRTIMLPHHKDWDAKVMEIAGGQTIYKVVQGRWQSPTGKVHKEPVIPVRIMCSEAKIREIMEFTIKHYQQEAVMCYQVSRLAIVMHAEEDACVHKSAA